MKLFLRAIMSCGVFAIDNKEGEDNVLTPVEEDRMRHELLLKMKIVKNFFEKGEKDPHYIANILELELEDVILAIEIYESEKMIEDEEERMRVLSAKIECTRNLFEDGITDPNAIANYLGLELEDVNKAIAIWIKEQKKRLNL
ncbi:MAG: hypothetical protein LBT59_14065 [Clostridiales bacterium]|jgi:hypothetical protein|nr:hypothetical protein [Clostridiales bacterium]